MAEKKEEKKTQEQSGRNVVDAIRTGNQITDTAIENAMKEIDQEKDDKKKRRAKRAICVGTYINRKTVLQLQQRRREDDITKEKLDATKDLLERLLGVECEIKNGECVPTKKKIDNSKRLTPEEHEREVRKLEEENRKKINESNEVYDKAIRELRDSYEGEYRYYINEW